MLLHGFRKRFATAIKLDKTISFSVGERLLGHKAYLDPEYFAPTKENLFQEFRKVMSNLIIDQATKLRIEAQIKDEQLKEIKSQKDVVIQQLQGYMIENERTRMNVQKILSHLKLDV